jgi:serine/threonine-protein kinase
VRHDPFSWVGQSIHDKYRIDAVVGEGGFGVVYRAHHLGLGSAVAVKCLKLPAALGPAQRDRVQAAFVAEGQILHRLSRANAAIVQALDVGGATAPNGLFTPYLVLEWLDGTSLEDELTTRRATSDPARPLPEALALLEPAFSALATAHAEGIAHRDVKPANLFLASVGGRRTLKVLDFGIAKVLGETLSLTQAMQSTGGEQAFTPQYGAPEQFDRSFGATGPWTDVYALALVLVEIATGRPALDGESVAQLFICTSNRAARPTARRRGLAVPDAVEAVLERALAVDPRGRFVGAAELFDALLTALGLSHADVASRSPGSLPSSRASRPALPAPTLDAPPSAPYLAARGYAPLSTEEPVSVGSSEPTFRTPLSQITRPALLPTEIDSLRERTPTRGRDRSLLAALAFGLVGVGLSGAAAFHVLVAKTPAPPPDDVAIRRAAAPPPVPLSTGRPSEIDPSLAALAGMWTSDTGRVYDAVIAEGELQFRVRDPEQHQGQGYLAGDVRFALSTSVGGAHDNVFAVRDVLRPFPPDGTAYETGLSSIWGASQARATCVGTWTAVEGRPLTASLDRTRLVVELVRVFPTRGMFDLVGTTVLECRSLMTAPVTRMRSVLLRT